jgi:hypothetical protein
MKDEVTFTFLLGGKLVCGQEDKPDSCLECDKLASCVMDMFYEAVGRNESDMAYKKESDKLKESESNDKRWCANG